ncbi:calcium-binding protein [Neisseria montereyensis]|uniref:Calcium-binding protein n=1 Tax=Neisseria montereyensis TaxID=2973938 RepID=A0ABT2FBE3_9NEIS|nr:hypothetical protein [Neisseria montereyensis]MCS4533482.1 hypothetical protein [Neisseria montereyensis]
MDTKQTRELVLQSINSNVSVSNISAGVSPRVFYGERSNNTIHSSDHIVEQLNNGIDTAFEAKNDPLSQNVENLMPTSIGGDSRGNDSDNILIGDEGRNRLWGNGGDDTLYGNGNNDFLDGGIGKDTMFGGRGNDIFIVDNVDDKVIELENQGMDTVFSSIDYTLPQYVENLTLTGTEALNGEGNDDNNRLIGNGNNNQLMGWKGNDIIYGLSGHDTIYGGDGADRLFGGSGNDVLIGGKDMEPLGNLAGEKRWLDFGDGNDYLDGGAGDDLLIGGRGDDTFYFARGYGHDTIMDYRMPEIETLADPEGVNTLRFGPGINPEDLDIHVDILPNGSLDDTWKINIKGTDDMVFIRNQSSDYAPAILRFEFDSGLVMNPSEFTVQGSFKELTIDNDQGHRINYQDFNVIGSMMFVNIEEITGGRIAQLSTMGDGQISEWIDVANQKNNTLYVFSNDIDNLVFVPDQGATEADIKFTITTSWPDFTRDDDALHTIHFNLKDLPDNGNEKLLFGGVGDSHIVGTDGNDKIYGGDGNDILDGKAGQDMLYGGRGDDTYLFGVDYGHNTIIDHEGSNSVRFSKGITWSDVTLETQEGGGGPYAREPVWIVGIKGDESVLTIENQHSGKDAAVTSFIFDNEILTHNMLEERLNSGITENTLNYADNAEPVQTAAVSAPVEGSYSYTDASSSMAMIRADDYSAAPLI